MSTEPQSRIAVVGSQYETETAVASASKAAAVFVVPSMLTPFYFNPDDIYLPKTSKGLTHLYSGTYPPQGLIPDAKANDPAQLATVLNRVFSLQDMLEAGVDITVYAVNTGRPHFDKENKPGVEVAPAAGALIETYRDKIIINAITPEQYEAVRETVPAASYVWTDAEGNDRRAVFFASQISAPEGAKFDSAFDADADPYLANLNTTVLDGAASIQERAVALKGAPARPSAVPTVAPGGTDPNGPQ